MSISAQSKPVVEITSAARLEHSELQMPICGSSAVMAALKRLVSIFIEASFVL